ncbi:TetR/AcrR family transcriptional regulator [Neobacillus dielmonensis]|uniref:TetR/AcrR family transcriptional regulator n=1 Tax=Neobacillus dielmonensis TaxID=1347369 RepID=UPI0005A91D90|nr:TetR/AcrR family transcriptional regulator [Neobacillus dielmonensis]
MNDRKQHVIKMAKQLFIDKGYQATSIQDILEYSGISKGTFYNYFTSKNELLMAIIKSSISEREKSRDDLLVGQAPSDIETFIKQVEFQLKLNRNTGLLALFEEVMVTNDADLKHYMERNQLNNIRWIHSRFLELFGDKAQPYLYDCAIMFLGILRENIKFNQITNQTNVNISRVVRYSVKRIENIVKDVIESEDQLLSPLQLEKLIPNMNKGNESFHKQLHHLIFTIKNELNQGNNITKQMDLLDFIEEEFLDSKKPRQFLIQSALDSLKSDEQLEINGMFLKLERLLKDYFFEVESEAMKTP